MSDDGLDSTSDSRGDAATPPNPLSEQTTEAPRTLAERSRIGNYRILEPVGTGGMGEVYRAEQVDPIRRAVALKVIKQGMDTKSVIARFEAERQALALMDHPNVATVYDAGSTSDGRPYFAMEYVKGAPITTYCDQHGLSVRERIEVFLQLCAGVQHAHQKSVIHRDLKPTNVLVTRLDDRAVVKIIDFGVAKAIGQRLTEKTMYTALGELIGTPDYMSPEQAAMTGEDVDRRSDVYSLGALLYELLTGTLPFGLNDSRGIDIASLLHMIREQDPPRPSQKLSSLGAQTLDVATARGTQPGKLTASLRGDLDWITMKALEKDRAQRYESAAAFAVDLQQYLRDQPVSAGPPSLTRRCRRFCRRHRMTVAIALVLLVSAMGVLVESRRQRSLAIATVMSDMRVAFSSAEISEGSAVKVELFVGQEVVGEFYSLADGTLVIRRNGVEERLPVSAVSIISLPPDEMTRSEEAWRPIYTAPER